MATALFPRVAEVTFDNFSRGEIVCRVQDGTNTTHTALGIVAATIDGERREYRFHVCRTFDRKAERPNRLEYFAALYSNGRSIPEGKLEDVRAAIVRQFKAHVSAWAERAYA